MGAIISARLSASSTQDVEGGGCPCEGGSRAFLHEMLRVGFWGAFLEPCTGVPGVCGMGGFQTLESPWQKSHFQEGAVCREEILALPRELVIRAV